jgi:hypothetical protein
MPFLLRSKGREHRVRAGTLASDPVYLVGPRKWVPFDELPPSVHPHGDGDLEVKEVEQIPAEAERPEPFVRAAPAAPVAAEKTADSDADAKPRGGKGSMAGRLNRKG